MSDENEIRAAIADWMEGLDSGDLERVLSSCDPALVICNQRQPTGHGPEAMRAKYGPIIDRMQVKSGYDIEHIAVLGDVAIVVGHFLNEVTDKGTGKTQSGEGRLILGYRRHADGSWKMFLDIDNNDERP